MKRIIERSDIVGVARQLGCPERIRRPLLRCVDLVPILVAGKAKQPIRQQVETTALFGALEKLPGVSVADHAVNAAGQPGVAVQQTFHGMSYQLIFNPRTYAFIGGREVSVSASAGLRVSTILFSYAILRLAVVNHAGQLP